MGSSGDASDDTRLNHDVVLWWLEDLEKYDSQSSQNPASSSQPSHQTEIFDPSDPILVHFQHIQSRPRLTPSLPIPSPRRLFNYLLSRHAEEVCRSDMERNVIADIDFPAAMTSLKTYSSLTLNPWEELMCAVIFDLTSNGLNLPAGRKSGLHIVHVLLNEPFALRSAQKTKQLGLRGIQDAIGCAGIAPHLLVLADMTLLNYCEDVDQRGIHLEKLQKAADFNTFEVLLILHRDLRPFFRETAMRSFMWRMKMHYPHNTYDIESLRGEWEDTAGWDLV
ncbi:hypothetical protein F5Y16DRAFT_290672 [Xylariaceae sp. FL0255]|nr:hypothetical protein F5Y16DRAFT_290672 [Xylariaceae sp. FL0255]